MTLILYADELVCFYNLCDNDVCETQYEVRSESPFYGNFSRDHHICYAVFIVQLNTSNYIGLPNIAFLIHMMFVQKSVCSGCTRALMLLHYSDRLLL